MTPEPAKAPGAVPIRIKYRESGELLMEAVSQAPLPGQRMLRWWAVVIIAVILISCLSGSIQGGKFHWKALAIAAAPLLLVVGFLVLFLIRGQRHGFRSLESYRKLYRKEFGRDESQIVGEIGNEGIFVSTQSGVATHYPWNVIVRVVERTKGLVVFHKPETFHWFPKTAFASEADYAAAIGLIRSKVSNFEKPD